MRYLLLILALPFFSVEASAPQCARMKVMASELEKQIQNNRLADCQSLTPQDLGLPADSVGFKDPWDYRCKDFSAIDMQLKSIDSEIAILRGIKAVKIEIANSKNVLTKTSNASAVAASTRSFFRNLKFAADLELFLGANNSKDENILSALAKADPKSLGNTQAFGELIVKTCKDFNVNQATVCSGEMELREEFRLDFLDLVKLGVNTEGKFNKKDVKKLQEALAIKNGKDPYSYQKFLSEIKNPDAEMISQEDLNTLKSLPEFSNSNKFDFLARLKTARQNLSGAQGVIDAQNTPSKFSGFLTDLKRREEWELKSKLSLVINKYKDNLPEACASAFELGPKVESCMEAIIENNKSAQSFEKAGLEDLLHEFKYGTSHLAKLEELVRDCVPDSALNYPTKCEGAVSDKEAELVNKSQMLTALRVKMFQSSPDLLTLRNYAVEQLASYKCVEASDLTIAPCYENIGNIAPEATALSGEVDEIIHVFEKPKEITKINQICSKGVPEKIPFFKELCGWKVPDPSANVAAKINHDLYEAPVSPEFQRNTNASNTVQTLLGVATAFFPRPPMGGSQNMYPYVTGMPAPGLHPHQSLTPQGLGAYYPTRGAFPYSNHPTSDVFKASHYDIGGSSVFNAPPGYNMVSW